MRVVRFEPFSGEPFTLPKFDIQSQLGNAQANSDFILTSGGPFDPHGRGLAREDPFTIGLNFEQIVQQDANGLRPLIDDTRRLLGQKGRLIVQPYIWRPPPSPAEIHERWIEARCIQVGHDRTLRHYLYQPFDLVFECARRAWHGREYGIWKFDGFVREDNGVATVSFWQPGPAIGRRRWDVGGFTGRMRSSPYEYKRTSGPRAGESLAFPLGNEAVTDPVITLIPVSADVTRVEIQGTKAHLLFTGRIAVGSALSIDCGAYSVLNNGIDAFDAFSLGPDHTLSNWLTLEPGDNPITVTYEGGAGEVLFNIEWIDAYA